jgi:protein gp37
MAMCKAEDNDIDNLETFRLLWLDADVNNTENLAAQQHLRSVINYLETFVDADECRQSIEQIPKEDRVVLIVSGELGRKVVPRIHEIQLVSSVYVYCRDKNKHKQWADQFKKVCIDATVS